MEAEDLIEDKIQVAKQGGLRNSNSAERGDNAESSAIGK